MRMINSPSMNRNLTITVLLHFTQNLYTAYTLIIYCRTVQTVHSSMRTKGSWTAVQEQVARVREYR